MAVDVLLSLSVCLHAMGVQSKSTHALFTFLDQESTIVILAINKSSLLSIYSLKTVELNVHCSPTDYSKTLIMHICKRECGIVDHYIPTLKSHCTLLYIN